MKYTLIMREALWSITAVLASFLATYALCIRFGHDPSPAVLSAALAVGLMRRPDRFSPSALLMKLLALPLIAIVAGFIGFMFHLSPIAGAALFTCALAISVWLRNFGERGAAAGSVIALAFMAILVVPVHSAPGTRLQTALLVIAGGVIAFLISAIVLYLALPAAIVPKPQRPSHARRPVREGKLPPATRAALQMFAALVLAFACGLTIFREHWPWVVLSAFIVTSGAMGRGDAVYKAILRFGGAVGGTLGALLVSQIAFPNSASYAAAVFVVLFMGIWLRSINYAFWAACATLIFALLQGSHNAAALPLFGMRVLCIVVGAICGIAATWLVYPVRTENVVRLRVAEALASLREILAAHSAGGLHDSHLEMVRYHQAQLERLAPPVRLHRAILRGSETESHPAALIERVHALLGDVRNPAFDRSHVAAEMRRIGELLKQRSANVSAAERTPEQPTGADKV